MTHLATQQSGQPALRFFGVKVPCIAGYWAEAWDLLEPAVAREGVYTKDSVEAALLSGEFQLWVAEHDVMIMAAITAIEDYPALRLGRVAYTGGWGLDRCLPFLTVIESWARSRGCNRFFCSGRPGLGRKLKNSGYRLTSVTLVKDFIDV